MISSYS